MTYRISELVGINLIDSDTLENLGAITDIIWDKPGKKCAFVTDNGAYNVEKIVSTDGDTMNVLAPTKTDVGETLVGKFAYETSGRFLCKVGDVEVGKTLKLTKIYLENEEVYTRGRVYAVKDVMLIRAPTPPRPKRVKPKVEQIETKIATETEQQVTVVTTAIRRPVNAPWRQNRKYGDFSFLIGKMTDKTITNFQGEVMVKLGERVTHDILRQAKISGKLIELCLHTK